MCTKVLFILFSFKAWNSAHEGLLGSRLCFLFCLEPEQFKHMVALHSSDQTSSCFYTPRAWAEKKKKTKRLLPRCCSMLYCTLIGPDKPIKAKRPPLFPNIITSRDRACKWWGRKNIATLGNGENLFQTKIASNTKTCWEKSRSLVEALYSFVVRSERFWQLSHSL